MHDLSDGFALVGVRSQPHRLSPAVHTGNTQLRADDGSAYVEITPGGAVTAVGPSSVTVRSGGSITLDAPRIVIKGLLSMQSQGGGATTATLAGSLNATGDVTTSNISLNSHTHADTPEAVGQAVLTRLRLFAGEWFVDLKEGTPYVPGVLGKHTQDTYDPVFRERILDTEGVTGIVSYASSFDGETRKLSVRAVIGTVYGETTIQEVF